MLAAKLNPNLPARALLLLHLEDSAADHQLACHALRRAQIPFQIRCVDTLEEFVEALSQQPVDVVLADYRLNGFTALDAWAAMPADLSRPPFILVSGAIGEALAVEAVQGGISDFVNKADLARLPLAIDRALATRQAQLDRAHANQALAASERRLAEFATHLQATIEAERAAIAREIHDDIGGALVAAKLDLAWVGRHAEGEDLQNHLEAAQAMLQHAMGASQRIMMNLRPAVLDQGLVPAIQWLTESFARRTGITTRLNAGTEITVANKDIELVAYRVAQEALTNASKYARCRHVRVDISEAVGVLTVEISDDGIGLSANDRDKPTAFGLRGLQERAQTVGGWLDISSLAEQGTTIILSVPLSPALAAQTWDAEA